MSAHRVGVDTILAKTQQLFRINGYHSTSMADVAVACGIRKPSLYHHFPSKEALGVAVLARVQQQFECEVFCHAYHDDKTPKERMAKLMDATETYFFNGKGGCLVGNFALETIEQTPIFSDAIRHYFNTWSDAIAVVLGAVMPIEEARDHASRYVAEIQGAIMMMRVYQDRHSLRQVSTRMNAHFLM